MERETDYECVYCHWNGDLSNNGLILLEHYTDAKKVKALIGLGSMSVLGEKLLPEEDKPHSFETPQDGVCVFYHRDRGEEWEDNSPFIVATSKDMLGEKPRIAYIYILSGSRWFYIENGGNIKLLTKRVCEQFNER